ncbi:MAG: hypothetical protein QOE99_1496 [Actinomycetota bacterium]|nr:hypothetical protein [Acidimicrobiales bacterium]MDT7545386.1 hypothetical protein [Actinomycetota bacterium]
MTAVRGGTRLLTMLLIALLATLVTHNVMAARASSVSHRVPQSAAMEDAFGVRFSRVAVVGDGGLITLTYVVLDAEKATRFQAGTTDPPLLRSESRLGGTGRVSLMRQGHNLRAGQTYYLVYQNTKGALRAGEKVTLTKDGLTLAHLPVL